MQRFTKEGFGWLLALSLLSGYALAGEVIIEKAAFSRGDGDSWRVSVTLKHDDTGWEHYADGWRVVDDEDEILGHRTLYHPHVDEQPFTRAHRVVIPADAKIVFVEAHDKVHGWSGQRLAVTLDQASGSGAAARR